MENTSIVACGEKMEIGCRVVLWDEPTIGKSFYKNGKYTTRNFTIEQLRSETKLFALHHSVDYHSKDTFNGLNARRLSVVFMIDDNSDVDGYATIYQALDMKDVGWSQGTFNKMGPGVEIAYHPECFSNPNLYSEVNCKKYNVTPRVSLKDKVHGKTFDVFGPTPAQVKSCIALLKGFCKLFPAVRPEFHKDLFGNVVKTVVKDPKGLVAHFQLTAMKVDPMGFPFEQVEKQLKIELTPEDVKPVGAISRFSNWFIDKCKF